MPGASSVSPLARTPIYSLPIEILVETFRAAIGLDYMARPRLAEATSLSLSHACARWRAAAINCKSLWVSVGMTGVTSYDMPIKFATRSKDFPLHFELVRREADDEMDDDEMEYHGMYDSGEMVIDEGCDNLEATWKNHDTIDPAFAAMAPRISTLKIETPVLHNFQEFLTLLSRVAEDVCIELDRLTFTKPVSDILLQRGCWHPEMRLILPPKALCIMGIMTREERYPFACAKKSQLESLQLVNSSLECLRSLGFHKKTLQGLKRVDLEDVTLDSEWSLQPHIQDRPVPQDMVHLESLASKCCEPAAINYLTRNWTISHLSHFTWHSIDDYSENANTFEERTLPLVSTVLFATSRTNAKPHDLFKVDVVSVYLDSHFKQISQCEKIQVLELKIYADMYSAFYVAMADPDSKIQCPDLKQLPFQVLNGYQHCRAASADDADDDSPDIDMDENEKEDG